MTQDLAVKTPTVVLIPLADLIVPPWNPRQFMDEGEMQNLVAYLEKGGAVQRILVWRGRGGVPWQVISGQRRVEAYRRLGREVIEAEIMDITLEEARVMANTSNQGAEVYWLDKYMNWETFMADYPGSQEQIAIKLGVAETWIYRSVNLMKVLNAPSRGIIRQSLTLLAEKDPSKNKGNSGVAQGLGKPPKTLKNSTTPAKPWRLTEVIAFQLTLLWDGNSLPEAQAQVEKVLPVVLSRQLSGPQVKSLVEWVKTGNSPETFEVSGQGGKGQKSKGVKNTLDTNEEIWGNLPKKVKVLKTPDGYKVSMFLTDAEGPVSVFGALMGMAKLKQPYDPTWENQMNAMVFLMNKRGEQGLNQYENPEPQKGVELTAVGQTKADSTLGSANSSSESGLEASTQKAEDKAALANNNQETTPPEKLGVWDQIKSGIKMHREAVTDEAREALVRDAKQAVNYQIRKVMRGFLKDIF